MKILHEREPSTLLMAARRPPLQRLLDLVDDLAVVSDWRSTGEDGHDADETRSKKAHELRASLRRLLTRFRNSVSPSSPIATLMERHSFEDDHLLVMVALLRRRLRSEEPTLEGRKVLRLLFDSSYELLRGVHLLSSRSPLSQAGVIVPDLASTEEGVELLDLRYRLSDRAFRLLLRSLGERSRAESREPRVRPYQAYLHYLMDLRRLALLYQKRAAVVFHHDDWDDVGFTLPDSVAWLNERIPRFSAQIRENLEATPSAAKFPLVQMATEYGLDEDECVVLVTLVFQELARGNPYLDACDLLKLVCRSEADLVRKRKLFDAESALVKHQLLVLEEMLLGKELSAEVYVPNPVVDRVLGPAGRSPGDRLAIDEESRASFQKFLRELDDSDGFFERL